MRPWGQALVIGCLGAVGVLGSPTPRSSYAIKDSHPVPRSWSRVDRAHPAHMINLQIGLKQSRFSELERHLYEVSDPFHHRYGQHLTLAEVNELVRPTDEALDLVHEWLASHGIHADHLDYTPARDWIKVRLPVSRVESLLETEYSVYADGGDTTEIVRAPEWSLPLHLHEHIATIQPTNVFSRPSPLLKHSKRASGVRLGGEVLDSSSLPPPTDSASVEAACNISLVTPLCLRTYYGTVNYTVQSADKNYMAINDFLEQVTNRSDVLMYLDLFRPEAAAAAYQFSEISIANGTLRQTMNDANETANSIGLEGDLDAETMLGISWPTPLVVYSTGGVNPDFVPDLTTPTDTDEPYLTWLQYILAQSPLPSVISTSYADDEQSISVSYATQVCNMFAQLGAMGVSVFFGSGDTGVGTPGTCLTNDGTNTSTFLPTFPASCPYVTTVGGTTNFTPEVAAYDPRFEPIFYSGGGFSNYFSRPSYQDAAVSNYLSTYVGSEYAGLYNPAGRGYPDIAAQSQNFSTVWLEAVVPVDGTSAATPTAAAIFTLVNDALIAAGKPPMGFLNPWIYSAGYKALNDITIGSSVGCNTSGFPAEPGWDAVSGYGTPFFPDILALLGLDTSFAEGGSGNKGSGWSRW